MTGEELKLLPTLLFFGLVVSTPFLELRKLSKGDSEAWGEATFNLLLGLMKSTTMRIHDLHDGKHLEHEIYGVFSHRK